MESETAPNEPISRERERASRQAREPSALRKLRLRASPVRRPRKREPHWRQAACESLPRHDETPFVRGPFHRTHLDGPASESHHWQTPFTAPRAITSFSTRTRRPFTTPPLTKTHITPLDHNRHARTPLSAHQFSNQPRERRDNEEERERESLSRAFRPREPFWRFKKAKAREKESSDFGAIPFPEIQIRGTERWPLFRQS